MIIDAHSHFYPDHVAADPALWAEENDEQHWLSLHLSPLQGWPSLGRFVSDMDDAHVDKAVLLGWYWENQHSCQQQMLWYKEVLQAHPSRFITFASVQPREGIDVLDDLERSLDYGVSGIGELFPAAQGYSIDDPSFLKVVEFAIEHDLPISLHVTEPVGHEYTGKIPSPLEDYVWLATEYPELKLILAHWGGLLPFYELNPTIKEAFKNVYYDTSASPLLYDNQIFETLLTFLSPSKILYGSDYPLRLFPKESGGPNFSDFLSQIHKLNLPGHAKERILGLNIKNLLNQS